MSSQQRCGGLVVCFLAAVLPAAALRGEENSQPIKVGDIQLVVPKGWQQQPPANRLRLAQFAVPAAEGDQEPAELSIFNFGPGGTVEQQVERWVGQFEPAGRKVATTQGQTKLGPYVFVELNGTYKKPIGPPIMRRTQPVPGQRMLVVMLEVEDKGHYFFKLVGPQKTVAAAATDFRKSFGGDAEQEKLLKLGDDE